MRSIRHDCDARGGRGFVALRPLRCVRRSSRKRGARLFHGEFVAAVAQESASNSPIRIGLASVRQLATEFVVERARAARETNARPTNLRVPAGGAGQIAAASHRRIAAQRRAPAVEPRRMKRASGSNDVIPATNNVVKSARRGASAWASNASCSHLISSARAPARLARGR